MHILIIPSEHYLTEKNPLAGIFQHHHAKILRDNGMKIGVISAGVVPFESLFRDYPYVKYECIDGIKIYRDYTKVYLPGRITLRFLSSFLINSYIKLFTRYIRENGMPDVIHAHNCLFAGAAALEIKRKYNIPYVITEHSSLYERGFIPDNHLPISAEVLLNTDVLTVVSNHLGESLVKLFGLSAEKYIPIFNVLDKSFADEEILLPKKDNSITFLSIGSLDTNKNHESLLFAFAKHFKDKDNFKLRIGGSGSLSTYLEKKAIELGIEKQFCLCGHLSRQEVKEEIKGCDVFVLPSKIETFGVVLIEALALGKPIIATNSGGPKDIVNSSNGLLVPVSNSDRLADALMEIVSKKDSFNAVKIRQDCIERFGEKTFFDRLNGIYSKIQIK